MLEIKPSIQDFYTAVFYITYQCNDNCGFCFVKDKIGEESTLSKEEIEQNFHYLNNKNRLQEVIISGGEPTLHPQAFEILDFFGKKDIPVVSLNTNGLQFSEPEFLKNFQEFLSSQKKTLSIAVSFSSVENFPPKTEKEKKKLQGISNLLYLKLTEKINLSIVLTLTKNNYKVLPELINFIDEEYTKHRNSLKKTLGKKSVTVEIRNAYMDTFMTEKQKESFAIKNFSDEILFIEKALEKTLKSNFMRARFFNLPYCYFKKETSIKLLQNAYIATKNIRSHIDKNNQLSKIHTDYYHKDVYKNTICEKCILCNLCNRIQPEYLEKYDYPELKPY